MTLVSNVSGLIPGFMALGVLGKSVETIPKNWGVKGTKLSTKKMIGSFVPIMAGVPMIRIVSTQVASL